MTHDPWSRPTIDDLRRILESIGKVNVSNNRENERLELSVPAEIRTQRGNTISAMTREISRTGIGMLHRALSHLAMLLSAWPVKLASFNTTSVSNGAHPVTMACS